MPDCCTGEEEGLRVIAREGELVIGMCLDEDGRSSSCLIDELGLKTLCWLLLLSSLKIDLILLIYSVLKSSCLFMSLSSSITRESRLRVVVG